MNKIDNKIYPMLRILERAMRMAEGNQEQTNAVKDYARKLANAYREESDSPVCKEADMILMYIGDKQKVLAVMDAGTARVSSVVPFQMAKILWKCDYNIPSPESYNTDGVLYSNKDLSLLDISENYQMKKNPFAPSYNMVNDWLREHHGLFVHIERKEDGYGWCIMNVNTGDQRDKTPSTMSGYNGGYDGYPEAFIDGVSEAVGILRSMIEY